MAKTEFFESGMIEAFLVTVIFFSPNFIFLFYYVQWVSYIYQFLLIFLLMIVIIHFRYNITAFKDGAKIDTLIDHKRDIVHKFYKDTPK